MPLRPMAPALGDATFVKVMRRSVVADAAARSASISQPKRGAAQSLLGADAVSDRVVVRARALLA